MSLLSLICNSVVYDVNDTFLNFQSIVDFSLNSFRNITQRVSHLIISIAVYCLPLKRGPTLYTSIASFKWRGSLLLKRSAPLTCVADLEAFLAGGVVGGPAEEQLVAPAREVQGLSVVPAQDHQQGALPRRPCPKQRTSKAQGVCTAIYITCSYLFPRWRKKNM